MEAIEVTERLALRQFSSADVDDLLALEGDPRVMRFWSRGPESRAQIRAEVLPRLLAYYGRYRDFGFWAAHTRSNGGDIILGVTEIAATTMAVNTASRRVLEKAGLTYARTVHLDWPDPLPVNERGDVEYRLHRSDWPPE